MAEILQKYLQFLPQPEQLKGLLSPQQTRLQAGLLGASSGVLPLMGVRDRPVGLGEVLLAAGTGAQAGLQQKEQSDLARALQGLELGTKLYEATQEDGLSERELRLQDYQNTFNVDRSTAIKLDKGLLRVDKDAKGKLVLTDITTGTSTPIKSTPTISSVLAQESGISTTGEELIEKQIPNFLTKSPDLIQESFTSSERDNAIELKGQADRGMKTLAQINEIISNRPELAGVTGYLLKQGKTLSEIASDFGINFIPKEYRPFINDPDISRLSTLEGDLVSIFSDLKAIKGNRTPTLQDYDTERERIGIIGLTSSSSVQERLKQLAKELNDKSKNYQALSGGFNQEIYGDLVKDYSLDPMFQNLFNNQVSLDGTRPSLKNDKPDPLGFR